MPAKPMTPAVTVNGNDICRAVTECDIITTEAPMSAPPPAALRLRDAAYATPPATATATQVVFPSSAYVSAYATEPQPLLHRP